VKRVAPVEDFEAAMRTMVADAREAGTEVVFLIFPRASVVSKLHGFEDAALGARTRRLRGGKEGGPSRLIGLFEVSCLDHRRLEDPMQVLLDRVQGWEPVYPASSAVRERLRQGANAYVRGELEEAATLFEQAVALAPSSPLARYDLGVSQLAAGTREPGLRQLNQANELACNAFLQYQILNWKIATDLDVPVVDLALYFQSRDGEELFLDPAHPNGVGHRIIAEAMWEAVSHGRGRHSRGARGQGDRG
jgi:tetratricopeptide (TPR) repeat protein